MTRFVALKFTHLIALQYVNPFPRRGGASRLYPVGGFLRLHCGVKQWVYTSVATKLCCSGALLCGAVLLCFYNSTLIGLQHELLHHGVDPRGDTAGMCVTCLPWPFSRTYLHRRAWRSRWGGCYTAADERGQQGRSQHRSHGYDREYQYDGKRHSVSPASSHASPTAIVTYRVGSVFGFNFHNFRTGPSSL